MEYIEEIQERVILVGVQLDENDNVKESLDELEELADTAGAVTVGKIIQNRETVHPGTYIGKGKIEEVRALMLATDATGIICDDELSPAQMNNLEHELECKVMDRTLLILDIFAKHATTSEGKIQVELAQLRYRASRLVGLGASLSRLGGGIGTRGSRREEAGKRPPSDPQKDYCFEGRAFPGREAQGASSHRKNPGQNEDSCYCWLYKRREVYPFKYPYRGWGALRGQAVCNPGPRLQER